MSTRRVPGSTEVVAIRRPGVVLDRSEIAFSEEEWEWCTRLARAMHDPEEVKTFWAGLTEQKKIDPTWSAFVAFPRELDVRPPPRPLYQTRVTDRQRELASRYAGNIVSMLRAGIGHKGNADEYGPRKASLSG